jgi:hypothetical protein
MGSYPKRRTARALRSSRGWPVHLAARAQVASTSVSQSQGAILSEVCSVTFNVVSICPESNPHDTRQGQNVRRSPAPAKVSYRFAEQVLNSRLQIKEEVEGILTEEISDLTLLSVFFTSREVVQDGFCFCRRRSRCRRQVGLRRARLLTLLWLRGKAGESAVASL